ncbi:MAG TPA: hypothetical protein VFG45_08880 [Candidatus Nitrosocosmicus sp.]|nr:hypothetical protein [Candidatus Nitrosocosmicus sp.]
MYHANNIRFKRFFIASLIQEAVFTGLTIFLVTSQVSFLKPEISRVIASGNAGTWFLLGYLMYLGIGVFGVTITSFIYSHLSSNPDMEQKPKGIRNVMAWGHFILMNSGIVLTCGLLMYGGYLAGASMLPVDVGGKGFTSDEAHTILGPLKEPIGFSIITIAVGVLFGGAGFIISVVQNRKYLLYSQTSQYGSRKKSFKYNNVDLLF